MIRLGKQASLPFKDEARVARPRRVLCTRCGQTERAASGCLMTGRREVSVRGLGIPAGNSGRQSSPAGDRDVVVVKKPGNAGGAKGVRESEP